MPSTASESRQIIQWALVAAVVLLGTWGWLLYDVHYFWGGGSYYNFGWFVPPMVAFFLYARIGDAKFGRIEKPKLLNHALFLAILAGTILLVTGVRLFSEADYYWRVPRWAHAFLLLGLSYAGLLLFSGKRGLLHFGFPIFLILMALPWPSKIQTAIILTLTQWVSDAVVIIVNLIGHPAVAMGNTIHVGDVQVGVDEACSGIRSLQTLVVMGLCFGEFFRFGPWRRLLLLFLSVVVALAFNGARALILTLVRIHHTEDKFHFWHDFLGNFNALICGVLIFVLGILLQVIWPGKQEKPPLIQWQLPQGRGMVMLVLAIVMGFLIPEAAIRGYYNWRDSSREPLPPLEFQWPEDGSITRNEVEVPKGTRDLLRYEFGQQLELRWQTGLEATMVHYGYRGENRITSVASDQHRPDACMVAIGGRKTSNKPYLPVTLMDMDWQVNHSEFSFDQYTPPRNVQVFYLIWQRREVGKRGSGMFDLRNRIALIKEGRRSFAREVVLVYFQGDYGDEFVRRQFTDLMQTLLPEEQ